MVIEIEKKDGVQIVRLSRPEKKNALTSEMYDGMAEALMTADETVGCNLLLGQPGAFTAGNDIADFLQASQKDMSGSGVVTFLKALTDTKIPLVIGVDGLAVGVGTTMLFHADMVYATERSVFKAPFVELGLVPEAGSSLLAPAAMGHPKAFELLCLGEAFTPQKALAAGFVNELVSEQTLEEVAFATAKRIAGLPREAMRAARGLLKGKTTELSKRVEEEMVVFYQRLQSDEARKAFMAFMMKGKG
ncbi:crotonase/enoyl-CoA hydratase family protein [Flexibacterium corallicola]|uniref:crotonase/enoyl-CoA hydratase family protein n=1 Tax=Flexibacterium corallicola TaxID=3037259 RepID=UPI00286F7177|nr:crotonase/enoyl-CoA hydratase family protein [Pseudovibrio sp. M1P-2-3]